MKPSHGGDDSTGFSSNDGTLLIRLARDSIKHYFDSKTVVIPKEIANNPRFERKLGCFVTLKVNDPEKSLRGCIGFPEPVYKLSKALPDAAVSAATQDPRFQPITESELDSLLLEVSILTSPVQIQVRDKKELPQKITIGKDGLIMRWEFGSGLLLPQVATEFRWDAEEFLCNLSMKAGAEPDRWLLDGSTIYKFQAQVFEEMSPKGKVRFATD